MKRKTKGQLSLGDAPSMILIVGLVFLTMATVALIGQNYGNALDNDNTPVTVVNESVSRASIVSAAGATLNGGNQKNGACGTVTGALNGTGLGASVVSIAISTNFTQVGCNLKNKTSFDIYNVTNLAISYPYTYSAATASSNATSDLESNISSNTSIAGIILTISLVGIVLTILIGVFMGIRGRTRI